MADLLSIKSSTINSTFDSRTELCKDCPDDGGGGGGGLMDRGVTNFGLILDTDVEKSADGLGSLHTVDSTASTEIITEKPIINNNSPKKDEAAGTSPEKKSFIKQYGGMSLALTASILFSIVLLLVKKLHEYNFKSEESSFWRYVGIMVPSIPVLMYFECGPGRKSQKHGSVFDTVWPLNRWDKWKTVLGLALRGILGSSSVILRYLALEHMTIGDASVISYSSPILVTILAHFLLGEKTGVIAILTAFLALIGVVIITKPPIITGDKGFNHETLIGTAFATGSLICSALMTIITRKIRSVQFALMLLVFGAIGVIQAFVLTHILSGGFSAPKGLMDTLMLVGVAGLSFIGQMSIILALKMEQAGIVSLIRTCDVVFGFIVQFIFLGVVPDMYSSIGGAIVFFGVLITAFRKWLTTLPQEHSCRRRLRFLLY